MEITSDRYIFVVKSLPIDIHFIDRKLDLRQIFWKCRMVDVFLRFCLSLVIIHFTYIYFYLFIHSITYLLTYYVVRQG
jgi:hypothetical protein